MNGEDVEGEGSARAKRARRRAILRWSAGSVGVAGLVLLALWTQRQPIAENFISRELNKLGARASYDIADIGLRTQRIEHIVLGDPAHPDLTADWVEVDLSFASVSPQVVAMRAGGVRIYGSLKGGVLSLGEVDKFRDPNSTAPFSLPDMALGLDDARMRLVTDAGPVGMRIDGSGNLRSGFRGKVAAVMPRASVARCGLSDVTAWLDVAMADRRPRISGPVRSAALGCPDSGVAIARLVLNPDVTLSSALDHWSGSAGLSAQALRGGGVVLSHTAGEMRFDGNAAQTRGQVRIASDSLSGGAVVTARAELNGTFSAGMGKAGVNAQFNGALSARTVQLAGRDPLAGLRTSAAGTPVAPLAVKLGDALRNAERDNQMLARFALAQRGQGGNVLITAADFSSRSGARAGLGPDSRFTLSWPDRNWALDGSVTMEGGGLPRAALRLARRPAGGLGGQLFVDPYAAQGARLGLEAVRFAAGPNGATHFTTAITLDGPLGSGGVRGLGLPIDGQMAGNGAIAINRTCTPLSLTSLSYGSVALGKTRLTLCPDKNALITFGPGGLSGGAIIRAPKLEGRLGDSAMRLTADSVRLSLKGSAFDLRNVDLSIGAAESPVRLTAASLIGAATAQGLAGRMDHMTGVIGTVPLLVRDAAGRWAFAGGVLQVDGALTLVDAQTPGRFEPLASRDFALSLRDGRITAKGTLLEPKTGTLIARADIVHDLGTGKGQADLDVPGITFTQALQPEMVSRLALGVVANARGTVMGKGQVRWIGSHVTSDGLFRTDKMDLAAAFGPVTGLSGEVRFTDLIGMVSAPGQAVRLASVNPGVEVTGGEVHYQLLPNQQVRIEGGEWPFSGGQLTLLPTTFDFSAAKPRTMAFRVVGMEAGAFINTLDLKDISATGAFDGLLPMVFDAQGGRIVGGVLAARQAGSPPLILSSTANLSIPCDPARQAGTLAYVGPVSNEELGTYGKLAFDALKNLQYKCLTILMDGAIDGELVTQVSFNGVNRGKLSEAPTSIARNFIGLPFLFNIRIEAPFRGLLNTAQSFVDPSGLIRSNLGDRFAPVTEKSATPPKGVAVQPAESDKTINGDHQ